MEGLAKLRLDELRMYKRVTGLKPSPETMLKMFELVELLEKRVL